MGRFSNGPVAFDYLVNFLSQGTVNLQPFLASQNVDGAVAVDLAFGGSQTGFANIAPGGGFHVIGLKGQVALFAAALGGRRASAGALYGIISGSNDYLRALGGEEPADPSDVVQNIGQAIQDLYSLGARRVIVLNLPDLGKAPIVTVLAPQLSDELTQLSTQHNTLLGNKLKELGDSLSHLQIIDVDVNALLQSIPPEVDQTTPALDVLFPGTGMSLCLFVNPADCENAPDGTLNNPFVPYLFWDAEHPTTGIHLFLANHLLDRLTH
jgi:outer membrane lipase/esterase